MPLNICDKNVQSIFLHGVPKSPFVPVVKYIWDTVPPSSYRDIMFHRVFP